MNNDSIKKEQKLQELLEITNIDEKQFKNLNYKEKQKYYKAKTKLSKVVWNSRDKKGNGITYIKLEEEKNDKKEKM